MEPSSLVCTDTRAHSLPCVGTPGHRQEQEPRHTLEVPGFSCANPEGSSQGHDQGHACPGGADRRGSTTGSRGTKTVCMCTRQKHSPELPPTASKRRAAVPSHPTTVSPPLPEAEWLLRAPRFPGSPASGGAGQRFPQHLRRGGLLASLPAPAEAGLWVAGDRAPARAARDFGENVLNMECALAASRSSRTLSYAEPAREYSGPTDALLSPVSSPTPCFCAES